MPVAVSSPSIRDVIKAHRVGIWRYLRFLGCTHDDAEDLLQDTFVTALGKPFAYRSAAESAAYLRVIARNLYLKRCRDQGSRAPLEELDAAEEVWDELSGDSEGDGYFAALGICLERLRGRGKRALELRYRHDLPRETIAKRLAMSVHGVKSLLRRARQTVRRCIEERIGRRTESRHVR